MKFTEKEQNAMQHITRVQLQAKQAIEQLSDYKFTTAIANADIGDIEMREFVKQLEADGTEYECWNTSYNNGLVCYKLDVNRLSSTAKKLWEEYKHYDIDYWLWEMDKGAVRFFSNDCNCNMLTFVDFYKAAQSDLETQEAFEQLHSRLGVMFEATV